MLRVSLRAAVLLCIVALVPSLASARPAGPSSSHPPQPPTSAKVAEPRPAATQLRSVQVTKIDGGYSITVSGNGPLFPGSVEQAKDLPPRIVLDLPRVEMGAARPITSVQNGAIERVRVAIHSHNPLVTRVAIDLTRMMPFTVEQSGDDIRVLLRLDVDTPFANASGVGATAAEKPAGPPGSSLLPKPVTASPMVVPTAMPAVAAPPRTQTTAVTSALFRIFLSDGRVLSSYGEWARLDNRVIFSMPTNLTRDPIELHLVSIPSDRVNWARTEAYAESVRAAAYVSTRGDADFAAFTAELAKVLNDVAKIQDPAARLATAERARQKLADWPNSHYGYRVGEVRDALAVLDEVIAHLRLSMGITRFDLSLSASAPLSGPPPPPLPPPSDAELVEQFLAAAAVVDSPVERVGVLQTVMRLIDRAIGLMPAEWAARMRGTASGELERERAVEKSYDDLRTQTLAEAAKLAARGKMSDLERLRDHVKEEDRRLGGQRAGDVAALLATIDLQTAAAISARDTRKEWERRAPAFRKYRRSTNGAFKVFRESLPGLEQIKTMSGPSVNMIPPITKRLGAAGKGFQKVVAPDELASAHALIASAWQLADNAFRLRLEAVSANSLDVAQRASSAAAGALLLYQRARADQLTVMEPPTGK